MNTMIIDDSSSSAGSDFRVMEHWRGILLGVHEEMVRFLTPDGSMVHWIAVRPHTIRWRVGAYVFNEE